MLEEFVAAINLNIFLREFSFSENTFSPRPGAEVEFADHVVWVGDILMLYQLKERAQGRDATPDSERRWFRKKVLGNATRQVRDTLRYLDVQPEIVITNQRGHRLNVKDFSSGRVVRIVIYAAGHGLPEDCRRVRQHVSSSGGFMHVVAQPDYLGICRTLITPAEIAEYFGFREELICRWTDRIEIPSEAALVGQFLVSDDPQKRPDEDYRRAVRSLRENSTEFDFSFVLERFADRIEYVSDLGNTTTGDNDREYYAVLAEFAKLNRTALREVKTRMLLSLEAAKNNEFQAPYRVSIPSTGCGFLFIPMNKDMIPTRTTGHQNLAYGSKYEQQLERQISASFAFDEGDYLIEWMYLDAPWQYDAEMEGQLKESYPFRPLKVRDAKRYNFEDS